MDYQDPIEALEGIAYVLGVKNAEIARLTAELAEARAREAALAEAGRALVGIVEGIQGAMEHGTFRAEKGTRLKDTSEWVAFYAALARLAP